ncbi:S8 family serine peptidase [Rheinheimera nanhaiensis]|uniref:Peptidase S8/S53 subtilisin kexin sedolisin n=1 Tax=Rheinheimera nanhaiensis E407-8 TaxID=562729 RepID=I1E282_9GAMM|nr:S8 family serine peptidase [Rheinheimera nanhaiensis]GAB60410.1 peptidase S8/S53 subtilisin kexin sedolisin [Rheinheimera nanhaiensis E407-8]
MKYNKLSTIATATLLAMGFTAAATASDRVIIQVDNSKKGVVKALAKQLGGDVKVDADGFIAAQFTGKTLSEIKGLLNNPHIKLIEADEIRKPMAIYNDDLGNPMVEQLTPYAVYQSQANLVNFNAGAGMKVCVIDSGLDRSNVDFDWGNITGDNDSGTGSWDVAGGPHGTHVAGTVGAADNGVGVVGMAPGVAMHIIKVFNAEGWGYSSDLAYAAQKCTAAGANIITMSLGGGGANSTESNAFATFTNNGGLVLAAAGNDGNSVRSYPAGYPSVMMIGANDANNNIADFSQFPSCTTGKGKNVTTDEKICVEVTAGGVDTLSTYPADGATSSSLYAASTAYASSAMENAGTASGSTYFMGLATATDSGAAGKVCVIDRGSISFHDKVKNCENSGGIGAVIINNEAGMLYGTLGEGSANTTSIPAAGAALEDRSALLAASSMTVTIDSSDYGYMSGTSMATPAVAGVAALVWSNFPSCTGTEIRNALKATAQDAGAAGKDVYFGYGIVKAKAAYDYLSVNGCAGGGDTGGGDTGGGDSGGSCKGGPRKCG